MNPSPSQNSPLDGAIGIVKRYISNPAAVTPETMQHLLDELESVKSYMGDEESQESEAPQAPEPQGGLMAAKNNVPPENA